MSVFMAAPCCVDCYSFVYFEVRGPDAANSFILLNVGVFFPYYIINFKLFFLFWWKYDNFGRNFY